jgi:hypothetical protein
LTKGNCQKITHNIIVDKKITQKENEVRRQKEKKRKKRKKNERVKRSVSPVHTCSKQQRKVRTAERKKANNHAAAPHNYKFYVIIIKHKTKKKRKLTRTLGTSASRELTVGAVECPAVNSHIR